MLRVRPIVNRVCRFALTEGLPVEAESSNQSLGFGDFQRRLNKQERYQQEAREGNRASLPGKPSSGGQGKSWEDAPTPRSERGAASGDISVRVPNRGWDETPRARRDEGVLGDRGRGSGRESLSLNWSRICGRL